MDLRLLRTFRSVVEHGSFTAAAGALGYTQSAVSQHIATLEASLGVRLVERRPFAVTSAGARLAEHAANILVRVDVATSELARIDRREDVEVASTPFPASTALVARLLARAHATELASTASLRVMSATEVTERVARGACAAGVVDGIVGPADPLAQTDPGLLTAIPLEIVPIGVLLPADHPHARRDTVSWAALADARFIDAPRVVPPAGPGASTVRDRRWSRTRFDGDDPSVLAALVAAGHGLALVPARSTASTAPAVRVVRLVSPDFVHRTELLVLRQHAARWTQLVRETVEVTASRTANVG